MMCVMLSLAFIIPPLGCGPLDESMLPVAKPGNVSTTHNSEQPVFTDIHGGEQRPFEEQDAKAIVLVFTMQDCPIANSYIPTLNRLVDTNWPRGVRLLMIHVDPQITIAEARKHAREYQIKAPVVIDRQHKWVARVGATRSPEVALFSPDGEIRYTGRIDDRYADLGKRRAHASTHDLQDAIDAVLAGRTVVRPKTEAIGCFIPSLPLGE
jgi:hypothetical protein